MLWTRTCCAEQPPAEPSRCSLMDQPCRALTMQHENPTARYKLSFKARKPAGVLLSRIPRKHSCQPGPGRRGLARRMGSTIRHESVCRYHGSCTTLLHQCRTHSSFFPKSLGGKRTSQLLPWLYGGDRRKIQKRHLQNPGPPRALELSTRRTRSSTKPRSSVSPN